MNDGNKVKQWPGDDVTPSGRGNALAILHYITERPYMESA